MATVKEEALSLQAQAEGLIKQIREKHPEYRELISLMEISQFGMERLVDRVDELDRLAAQSNL